ncbi:ferrous iron transport protein B [Blastopirellula sp. JC732]|uniref:Ferrous iron transport protein B n=1 Tax=Blastopirellula sediminis TaxID=2894196 RepID=A0A9X1SK76_9BACT|nr:ferrous iron transport protein B [Blastopirellula sediminis]MCC9607263.1 ferrous iron transport protein B [Blastopirellula sediminis]MCC9629444.1 ferrous iron transport protein B [Blastopirellula sediminis]
MSIQQQTEPIAVALIGNPNTGKSTLFNALSGVRQRTGNYPGVTVEKKHGTFRIDDKAIELIDLPGSYSLAPRSPDEMVAVDVLLGRLPAERKPQAVLVILDAGNLERNLYILSQVLELRLPTIVALNMIDAAAEKGVTVDVELLSQRLGVPVIPTRANQGEGVQDLRKALANIEHQAPPEYPSPFPPAFREEVAGLQGQLVSRNVSAPRYLVERLLLDTSGYLECELKLGGEDFHQLIEEARKRLKESGAPVPAVEAMSRYGWVRETLRGVVERKPVPPPLSDRIDRVMTHPIFGTIFFALLMMLVFTTVFSDYVAGVPMGWIEAGFEWLGELVGSNLAEGPFRSLLVDGVIAGVGGVLVFLPQICILFFFIAILEDCGYMARAAYLMDRLFSNIGLSGKSFIPLLSSFACAIPGVMATRVIENRRDRLVTMLIAPLMSCSARIPVYVVMIAAFVPPYSFAGGLINSHALTFAGMYLVGIVAAVIVAFVLKKTILRGATPPFVLELPSYKWPSMSTVGLRVAEKGWSFIRRAGTLIFASSVLVWAAAYYPHNEAIVAPELERLAAVETELEQATDEEKIAALEEELAALDHRISGALLRDSYLGRAGRWIEPVVRPLGWDWRIGCATLASFPAREVIIGTLGVIFDMGDEEEAESLPLREKLQAATWDDTDKPLFNLPVALSVMVFFALCAQCAATLAVIKRETNSWRWPIFTFVYMTTLAYVGAFAIYRIAAFLTETPIVSV